MLDRDVTFEGENLEVLDTKGVEGTSDVLVIKDGKEHIAVFNTWIYWRKIS